MELQNNMQLQKKRQMWASNQTDFYNGTYLDLLLSVGNQQTAINKNIHFIGEESLYYICGKHIVQYDIIKKRQQFILKNQEDEQVTAFSFTQGKSGSAYLAVGLMATEKTLPIVQIYTTGRNGNQYKLVHSHLDTYSRIYEIQFIKKNKYLLSMAEFQKQFIISVWNVQTQSLICQQTMDYSIRPSKICISPYVAEDFTISGNDNKFYLFKLDLNFNKLSEETPINFQGEEQRIIDHCWVVRWGLLCLCYRDKISLYRNFQKLNSIDPIQDIVEHDHSLETNQSNIEVSTISTTKRGLCVGFQNCPYMSMYEVDKNDNIYQKGFYKLSEQDNEKVYRINSFSNSEDDMYVSLSVIYHTKNKTGQNEQKVSVFYFNIAMHEAIKTPYNQPFEKLFDLDSHKAPILDLILTANKNILVTFSEDKYVKFWDFNGQDLNGVFQHYFHEVPFCISMHPHSNQCVFGFREGIKFYQVLDDDLKQIYSESMKQCTATCYSSGGHVIAIASQQNILLYDSYTYSNLMTLTGHAASIRDLKFSKKDRMIVSVCTQGVLYCWQQNHYGWQRVQNKEHAFKQSKYNCVTYDSVNNLVVGLCADYKMRIFEGSNKLYEYDSHPISYTSLLISERYKVCFIGTSQGSIKVILWPIQDYNQSILESIEFPVHQSNVTYMNMTADHQHLVSGSEDGSIFISVVKEIIDGVDIQSQDQNGNTKYQTNITKVYMMNNFSMVTEIGQKAKQEVIKEQEYRIQNLKSDIEDEKEKHINQFTQQIKGIEDNNRFTFNDLQNNMNILMEGEGNKHQNLADQVENLADDHQQQIQQLESKNNKALKLQYDRNDLLKQEINRLNEEYKNDYVKAEQEFKMTLNQVENDYDLKYNELYTKFNNALFSMKEDQKKFKEVMIQSDQENDEFLQKTKKMLINQREEERERSETLRNQNSKNQKEIDRFGDREIRLQQIITDTELQIKHMEKKQEVFSEKYKMMLDQLSQKESIINNKEQMIKDYRSKNIHLQNFRSVYDYRVNNLKEERGPLLEHLQSMDKHVKTMYNELLDEAASYRKLNQKNIELTNNIDQQKGTMKTKSETLKGKDRKIETFKYQIQMIIKNEDYKNWVIMLQQVYKKEFEEVQDQKVDQIQTVKKDKLLEALEKNSQLAIQQDLIRHRDNLSQQLITSTQVNKKIEDDRDDIFVRIQNENTNLIKECNNLRKDRHQLKKHLGFYQKSLKQITQQIQALYKGENYEEDMQPLDNSEDLIDNYHNRHISNKKTKQPTELPYIKYQKQRKEVTLGKLGMTQNMQIKDELLQSNDLLSDLLGGINQNDLENEGINLDQLKDKVNRFLYIENVSLPQLPESVLKGSKIYQSNKDIKRV